MDQRRAVKVLEQRTEDSRRRLAYLWMGVRDGAKACSERSANANQWGRTCTLLDARQVASAGTTDGITGASASDSMGTIRCSTCNAMMFTLEL